MRRARPKGPPSRGPIPWTYGRASGHALSISSPHLYRCVTPLVLRRFTLDLALSIHAALISRRRYFPPFVVAREMHRRHMSPRPSPSPSIYVSTHCEILLSPHLPRHRNDIFANVDRGGVKSNGNCSTILLDIPRGWIFFFLFFFPFLFSPSFFFFLSTMGTLHVVIRIK